MKLVTKMGGCLSKKSGLEHPISGKPSKLQSKPEEKPFQDISSQNRKNLKQKRAVVDHRIRPVESGDLPGAIEIEKVKSSSDIKLINLCLQKHFIFSTMTENQKFLIIDKMRLFAVHSNEVIFNQGSKGSAFFIISTGRVDVIVNEVKVNSLKPGDSFGELALIHDTPRSATVKSIINSSFWTLDRTAFRSILQDLNVKNYQENKSFINSIALFDILSDDLKESLLHCLTIFNYRSGVKIVNEGDPGDLLYIIKEGSVNCTQQGKVIRRMEKGDYFGDQALLYGSARTASVVALEDVVCLGLSSEELSRCFGTSIRQIIYKNSIKIAFEKNLLLKKLDKQQTENIINFMQVKSFKKGEIVIPAGSEKSENLIVVVKGEVKRFKIRDITFKLFDVVGAEEVINEISDIFSDNFVAVCETDVAMISSSGFFNAIGGSFKEVTSNNEVINLLKRVQLMRGLSQDQLTQLATHLKIKEFNDGDTIVEQNNPGDCLFIVKSGKVDIIKDGQSIRSITKHDYFGERSLLFNNIRTASVIARKKVECWVIFKKDFLQFVSEGSKKLLMTRIDLQDDSIQLTDLLIIKKLGSGMFGNVFLTMHKVKRTMYALKTVDRRKVEAYEIEENIVLERKILLQLDHMMIMKLVKTFKDSKRVYFLVEFIRGMDLFDVLRELNLLKECDARFYTGCISLILEHLHERNIIFRDLKPENVVIDAEGYPKLIDFGTAKFVNGRTYTIVGTPHYMAPEVITGHGYGLSADFWSLGVMVFEFLFGNVPFGEDESNPYTIYEKVQERRLVFPKWVDNKNKVKEFINQLLSKNPAVRTAGSIENFKANPWFIGFNWDKLASKDLKPPFTPQCNSLEADIENAVRNGKSLNEVITKIEEKETIPKTKRHSNYTENWDIDF
jgi:cGMP-dependent protein kinase